MLTRRQAASNWTKEVDGLASVAVRTGQLTCIAAHVVIFMCLDNLPARYAVAWGGYRPHKNLTPQMLQHLSVACLSVYSEAQLPDQHAVLPVTTRLSNRHDWAGQLSCSITSAARLRRLSSDGPVFTLRRLAPRLGPSVAELTLAGQEGSR